MSNDRSRNKKGRWRKKRSDTHQETLEKKYGNNIPLSRDDKHLDTILRDEGEETLSGLLKKNK